MDAKNIFAAILTSSLISSALTSIVNWYIQRNNYKIDYYKKLLEKRIEAYEMIIFYIDEMKQIVDLNDGKSCHRFLSSGRGLYTAFSNSVALGTGKSFWLSYDVSNLVSKFNIFLHENINNQIQHLAEQDIDNKLRMLGIRHRDKITEFRISIENQVQNDFKDLHNIVKFTKDINHGGVNMIRPLKSQQ